MNHENEVDRAIDRGLRKLLLSRLFACLAIGFAAAYSMFRAVIYLKHLIGL
jgi:hypothetical protein